MFGKAPSSSANKRLFGSSLSVDCQSVFHLLTSFPRISEMECLSPRTARLLLYPIQLQCLYLLYSMGRDKADGGRGDLCQKIDLAFG